MKPSIALDQQRSAVRAVASGFPVANVGVFGSVLHGTDREGSDIDLLVDANTGATLFDLCGLQEALQQVLGVKVDLLTPEDLPTAWRDQVVGEAKPV
jgi:predicted nucleotidyltransferase